VLLLLLLIILIIVVVVLYRYVTQGVILPLILKVLKRLYLNLLPSPAPKLSLLRSIILINFILKKIYDNVN